MIGFLWQDLFLSATGYKAVIIRLFGALPVSALAWYLSRHRGARRFISYLSAFFWLSYAGLTAALFISYGPGPYGLNSSMGFGSFLLILFGVFTFANLRFWPSLLVGWVILAIYTVSVIFWTEAVLVDFILGDFLTAVALMLGLAINTRFTDRAQRRQFETSELLQQSYTMVEQEVRERTAELQVVNTELTAEIAENKRAEAKIHDQTDLLDQTNDAILVHTLAGAITFWNRGAERLFGWTAQDILGRHFKENLIGADLHGKVEAAEQRVLERGYWLSEMNYLTHTGQPLIGQTRTTLVRDAAGVPQSFLILITDLTEQRKLEAQFLRTQRLEAVGTLASGIAHDLNNILAPILMAAPVLRDAQTPAEAAPILDLIESSAQRAADVVRQLLTFGRGQSGERITLHLKHLLRDLRHIIQETFPKNIRFATTEAPDLWPLLADPTQLHQILLNLCINARDAMPEGGTLSVIAANFQADDHYASMVAGAQPGAYLHLQVNDTGCGIRPEDLDKIFDPFFTTKELGRGTGLGLATVYRVVTGHGGFVQVRSQLGQGTTFAVYLPASPAAVASAEPTTPAPALAGQGELILVVDDEEGIRQITQQTLVRHGYRAVTAGDGAEAIVIFAQRSTEIKAVITDLMMPVMDGLGLVQVLTKMTPGLPVVVSTGVGSGPGWSEKLTALRRLGVGTILTKPHTANQLLHALHTVLPAAGPEPHASL